MTDTGRRFLDDVIQQQYERAKAAGAFDIEFCCSHIKGAHKGEKDSRWCRACWYRGGPCAPKTRVRRADDETVGG